MKIEKDGNFSTIISSKILFFLEFPCTQPAFSCSNQLKHHKMCEICSKLKLKTPKRRQDVILVSLLINVNRFCTLFWCFHWLDKLNK